MQHEKGIYFQQRKFITFGTISDLISDHQIASYLLNEFIAVSATQKYCPTNFEHRQVLHALARL